MLTCENGANFMEERFSEKSSVDVFNHNMSFFFFKVCFIAQFKKFVRRTREEIKEVLRLVGV